MSDPLKWDASARNRRIRKEAMRLGFSDDVGRIPLDQVSVRLLHLCSEHNGRVMNHTPAGRLKLKLGRE